MVYNFVAFTLIFALFASIIYGQISLSLFSPVHEDLQHARQAIEDIDGYVEEQIGFRFEFGEFQKKGGSQSPTLEPPGLGADNEAPPGPEIAKMRIHMSMRVQSVVRNGEGEIVNSHALGRLYWENVLGEIPFSPDQLDGIVTYHLSDGSYFHSLSFLTRDSSGASYYVQLLTNMDGEYAIINSFVRILIICVAVFVLLSITASYFLSKMSMAPLLKSWNRQTEFVGNASHELRTPLTIIQNKLESLLAAPQETILQRADDIAVSLSETRRLSKLTSDLMTLARADSNATQLEKEPFDLDGLVHMVSEPYGELASMEEKTLTLDLQYRDELLGDKGRIHELMVILLDNALKYTREGDRIQVRTASRDGRVVIEVADTGIGISEETSARIFDRFYREEKARSRERGGSGLGLSIAKWIVEAHGGSIRAYPNRPAGTVVQIKL